MADPLGERPGPAAGAAAYDPGADRWRVLPASPAGTGMEHGRGVRAGGTVVFGAGTTLTEPGARFLMQLDPGTGSWRRIDLPARAVAAGATPGEEGVAGPDDRRARRGARHAVQAAADPSAPGVLDTGSTVTPPGA